MKISSAEQLAIRQVLKAGQAFGYGNMISHLNTAWAMSLMIQFKVSEKDARAMCHGDGYPFAMQRDIVDRGEWDETGEKYRSKE